MRRAARLSVKAVPGASQDKIVGWYGDALRVRVAAPADKGRANAALIALLAQALGLPRGAVVLVSGSSSPRKVFEVQGLSSNEIQARLDNIVGT
ncbi:MAG TPA: DUF167 domain-containing protein [Gammaproteobacteria bacterium]|jgi:uncharacterized protein (TIGR00251 family)|nr:DUF167 domain-containing protein [Gammaproteobacteria bacterium]